ncbi:EAL domain-containing protein [Legionella sp. km772]|uniref:EAL domain-containing protein n=1 Tax=Legionella sp. km772 TaxID=2498111 RepID=UPI001F17418E|nr:EAL domain-containing protein [Legionella sp. km772]
MRHQALHGFMHFIYKHFKVIWSVLTLIVLIGALYFNMALSYNRCYQEVLSSAKDLSKQVDGFIEDLLQEVYTLPFYGKTIHHCTQEIYESLEHIVLNNPKISGLIITDKNHHSICSTIEPNILESKLSSHSRTLLGPFTSALFDQPVYLLRQKIGPYYIDILLVSSVLKAELETSNILSSEVVLYDKYTKKDLIKIEHSDDHKGWITSPNQDQVDFNPSMFATDKLQSIDGIILKIFENTNTVHYHLWLSQVLVFLTGLALAFFLYFFISHNISKHYSLKRAIKLALKNEQFFPVYQPVFDREHRHFCGVEVLLRWEDHDGNIIMPDSFIEEAESSHLIVPITMQIIEIAFLELQPVLKKQPDFHIAVNLSVTHFKNLAFFDSFDLLRIEHKIQAQQIIFEITERDLLDRNDILFLNKMNQLRSLGYSLAIDDYGTGHASIAYLQSFPFNYLKIDKLFIQAIGTKAITESLNDAIIQMAKGLNLIIIAEGVETKEQVDYLAKNEVRYLQGWYFSKAVSIDKIMQLIQGMHNELSS